MKFYRIIILFIVFSLAACEEEVPPIGDPLDRISAIEGSWTLSNVLQTELSAEEKGFPEFVTSKDITNAIPGSPFSDFQISFSGNQVSTVIGNAPIDIPEGQGSWQAVTEAGNVVTNEVGVTGAHALQFEINGNTYLWELGSMAQLQDEAEPRMFLQAVTLDETGKAIIRYDYEFVKN